MKLQSPKLTSNCYDIDGLICQTIIMPKPQIREGYSDTDSTATENDECGEESEIPVASNVEEPCEELEGKTR